MGFLSFLAGPARADLPVAVAHAGYPHDRSDLPVDPDTRYGILPNGMRYVLYRNRAKARATAFRFQIVAGSMQESDAQRGLAHFVEHMAFNGSTNIAEGEFTRLLARNAFQFGSDVNAFTDYEKTDYVLGLPSNEEDSIDTGLFILREVAGNLSFDAEAIERERGVILSEERMRASGTGRSEQAFIAAAHPGELYARRDPIGTLESIRHTPRQALLDYYQDFYRPDNAILVAVGDFDLGKMERKINATFGDWQPARPGPLKQTDYGKRTATGVTASVYAEKGLFDSESVTWFRPFITAPDNRKSRTGGMAKYILTQVLNARFRRLADDPQSPYLNASLNYDNKHLAGNFTQLSVVPRPGRQAEAFSSALRSLFQLKALGVGETEIADFVTQFDALAVNMVAAGKTRFSDEIANEIMSDIDEDGVHQSARQYSELWAELRPQMTADLVNSYIPILFEGDGPLLFRQGEDASVFTPEAMTAAFAEAAAATPEAWAAAEVKPWPYTNFGPPQKPVAEDKNGKLNYRHYVFANGVTANVRVSPLVRNQIIVSVRFGGGYELFSPSEKSWPMATQLYDFPGGGLGKMSREEMGRALASKSVSIEYGLDSDSASLTGYTTPESFETQMQVLMAYTVDPAYSPSAYANFRSSLPYLYSGLDASPETVMATDSNAFLAGGDLRYVFPSLVDAEALSNDDLAALYRRTMNHVPVEVTITGDVSDDLALKVLEKTFANLPPVPSSFKPAPGGDRLSLPTEKTPQVYIHQGRDDQSVALIVFPGPDALGDLPVTRGLGLLASILSARLSDDLREQQGATYDIAAQAFGSEVFKGYGYIYVQCTLNPDQEKAFEDAVVKAAADLRDHDVTQDELDRAREPLLDGVNDKFKNNEDWQETLAGLYGRDDLWNYRVDVAPQYHKVTVADIRRLAQTWLRADKLLLMKAIPAPKP